MWPSWVILSNLVALYAERIECGMYDAGRKFNHFGLISGVYSGIDGEGSLKARWWRYWEPGTV